MVPLALVDKQGELLLGVGLFHCFLRSVTQEIGQATLDVGRRHDCPSQLRASAANPRLAWVLTEPGDTPRVLAISASDWSR